MSDWADEKARQVCDATLEAVSEDLEGPHDDDCLACPVIAAALREAREQGAREERRACYIIANSRESIIADKIASRGPMSQGGECPCNPIDGKCVYCGRPEGGGE